MPSIDISGSRIEYVEQGSGEPVVLLHSSASSSTQWRALMERLSERFRVVAPDLYGYGGTSHWAGRGAFCLEHEAQLVYALLGRAGEPAHLVGHSFGGAVALHLARTRPDLFASLTVIEPVAFHLLRGRDELAFAEISAVAAGVGQALACGDYFNGIAGFVDYWSGPGAWAGIPQEKRPGFATRLAKVALDFQATLNEPAALEDFAAMALPTLVVQGTSSPRPTRRICELLAEVLPDAQSRIVDGAGHMAPVTHRDAVNAAVFAHLDSIKLFNPRREPCKPCRPQQPSVTPSASRHPSASAGTSTAM
jgi:pimeloyl-ACP methyl ester carboxylesterase